MYEHRKAIVLQGNFWGIYELKKKTMEVKSKDGPRV